MNKLTKVLDAVIILGHSHDGAERLRRRLKFMGERDKRMFEFAALAFGDSKNFLSMRNHLAFFVCFLDMQVTPWEHKLEKIMGNMGMDMILKQLERTTFTFTLPKTLAQRIDADIESDLKVNLKMKMNFCFDQKAGLFYTGDTTLSYRCCIPWSEKSDFFLKMSLDQLATSETLPSESNVKNYEDLFLVTRNLQLLSEDPSRPDLKIPEFVKLISKNSVLSDAFCRMIDFEDDNLHGDMSIHRIFLKCLESFFKTVDDSKGFINSDDFWRQYYTAFVDQKVYCVSTVFQCEEGQEESWKKKKSRDYRLDSTLKRRSTNVCTTPIL